MFDKMFEWCKCICKFEPTPLWIGLLISIAWAIYFVVGSFLLEKLFAAIKKKKNSKN